jgi:riboflavin kinase / FMN adenylyltransferase
VITSSPSNASVPICVLDLAQAFEMPAHLRSSVVAIGNFDGLHLGHRDVLARARIMADAASRPVMLMTFAPHPRAFFRPDDALFELTPPALKADLAARLGADGLILTTFDKAMAALSGEAFLNIVLDDILNVSGVVVGEDFRFGAGRTGDGALLQAWGARTGRPVAEVPATERNGQRVSSSQIRDALRAGDIVRANDALGYRWIVRGTIGHGDKRGRTLGYPTANITPPAGFDLRHGIYSVRIHVSGQVHDGVASYGRRPTFDDGSALLEVHVFDFAGDLYGARADVEFIGWIRPELRFDSADALVKQMDADSAQARLQIGNLCQDCHSFLAGFVR